MMPPVRAAFRALVLTALIGGLSGCFLSETPLINEANAAYPFTAMTIKTEEGETGFVKRQGGFYSFVETADSDTDETSAASVLFYEVADDLYIVQATEDNGEATYLLAKRQDGAIITRSDCDGLDAKTLAKAGVTPPDSGDRLLRACYAKTLKSLIALAQSSDTWAGQTTALQIVSVE